MTWDTFHFPDCPVWTVNNSVSLVDHNNISIIPSLFLLCTLQAAWTLHPVAWLLAPGPNPSALAVTTPGVMMMDQAILAILLALARESVLLSRLALRLDAVHCLLILATLLVLGRKSTRLYCFLLCSHVKSGCCFCIDPEACIANTVSALMPLANSAMPKFLGMFESCEVDFPALFFLLPCSPAGSGTVCNS
jgi:hypothetical protein